ncbi:MAG TPA: hypothetical protein VHF69_04805, partial [Candidatus Synoicihabitans sp.]|nr:hypothetical protein [Candidatus Synoicihabitans sp.]
IPLWHWGIFAILYAGYGVLFTALPGAVYWLLTEMNWRKRWFTRRDDFAGFCGATGAACGCLVYLELGLWGTGHLSSSALIPGLIPFAAIGSACGFATSILLYRSHTRERFGSESPP